MYFSEVRLVNWRSYEEAVFSFDEPRPDRPLVLIGAMNGTGKTSFLIALYLGLFGKHGLRHVEGFDTSGEREAAYYREAIESFRRRSAESGMPSEVEVEIKPCHRDGKQARPVRIRRRWHFRQDGKLQPTNRQWEELTVEVGGEVRHFESSEEADHWLDRHLFASHLAPAFFFDGEQAQRVISASGDRTVRRAVGVLFGTEAIQETRERVRNYVARTRSELGGAGRSDKMRAELDDLRERREMLRTERDELRSSVEELASEYENAKQSRENLTAELEQFGASGTSLQEAQRRVEQAESALQTARDSTSQQIGRLGLALAVGRHHAAVLRTLRGEQVREEWERLRDATRNSTEKVLAIALPVPAAEDELLGHLRNEQWEQLRERFRGAIDAIHDPPPDGCAEGVRFGFVSGRRRADLVHRIEAVASEGAAGIVDCANALREAEHEERDAKAAERLATELPAEVERLRDEIGELNERIGELNARRTEQERRVSAKEGELQAVGAEIGRLERELDSKDPHEQRFRVANRVHDAIEEITEQLVPLTLDRLQSAASTRFKRIADLRYARGEIVFDEQDRPVYRPPGNSDQGLPDEPVSGMSGFERRSYGIAFSLALAEMTGTRMPLVIDTPLGNADTEYRKRMLDALVEVELDQIILLTHNAEFDKRSALLVGDRVGESMLVEWDAVAERSVIRHGEFFYPLD